VLRKEFQPNKISNAIDIRHELKILTDKGKKFTVYHKRLSRIDGALSS
jgi:hypothetical protein